MPAPPTGYTANLVNDIVKDAGKIVIGGATFGILKGGARFDPGWEIQNLAVGLDAVDAPIYLLDRKIHGEPVLSFTIVELGPSTHGNQVAKLEAGASSVDTGTTPATKTTITPKAGRTLYAAGDYLSDVYLVATRTIAAAASVKGYPSIHFAKALVRKWDLQTMDKDKVSINVEIAGRKDMAAGTLADAAFDLVFWETAP